MANIGNIETTVELNIENYKINTSNKGKSTIIIGKKQNIEDGGNEIKIEIPTKFNKFQKKMWKFLLNIDIEDIKE
jgi:hypothetical protein